MILLGTKLGQFTFLTNHVLKMKEKWLVLNCAMFLIKRIGKNPNSTLVRDSAKITHISGGQPSSYELAKAWIRSKPKI